LARRKPLRDRGVARAKQLMVKLKEMGFTNREISDLTGGGWSEVTVKQYTRGATVEDRGPKDDASSLLSQMVSLGLTLKDVEVAVSMKADLNAKGLGFEDISTLLEEAKRSKVSVKGLLQMYRGLKDLGLSITQLSEALSYKPKLEEAGFTIEALKEIYQASKAYGGYGRLMEAINKYGSLEAIEAEGNSARSEREELERNVNRLKEDVKKLEEERARIEEALKLYGELKALGFDEVALKELKNSSDRYGGVKDVVEAVNKYTDLAELKSEVKVLEEKKLNVEANLKKAEADYAHLQSVIGMCETLLYKFRFSVPAITDIYEVAKKYGEPLEVLKAIGRYGERKAIEDEVGKLAAKKGELESRVKELSVQVQGLRALTEELKTTAGGLLKPFVAEP
jgi:DNA repair exonuclease SbcCD ATPase subunit